MRNKYIALVMAAALCFLTFLPCYDANAMPAMNPYTYDLSQGSIIISGGTNTGTIQVKYNIQNGSGQIDDNISTAQPLTITDSDPSVSTANHIGVYGYLGTINITLDNVNINRGSPFAICDGTTVDLTLVGLNTLNADGMDAGLTVLQGATLDITAASTGSLTATGGNDGGAGIGGFANLEGAPSCGTVTIDGGTVVAKGCNTSPSAGIGGGYGTAGNGGDGGIVTINGGTVVATGGSNGIGGGSGGHYLGLCGTLTVNGGSVKASSIQPTVYNSSNSQEYPVTISGLPASAAVSYTVNGGNPVSCSTDAGGNLYLWQPQTSGSATVNIQISLTSGGAAYLAAGQVGSSNANNFTAYPIPTITGIGPTSGPEAGGTSVTISGSGLTGATAVKFGSTTGSGMTVISDTSLTVTSPAGSGTVDVTITTPNGTSAVVSSDQFTYVAPNQDQAAPTGLTGIAPTTAANNDGKITGVTDGMEYQLQGAAGYTSVPASAAVITGLAAGTYQVRLAAGPGLNAGADADVVVPAYIAPTFLSLGDSIACGMSAAPGSDYTHLFYNHLLTDPAYSQLSLNNLAVSGDKSSDLLQRLQTNAQYSAAIGKAKVITLSIGGDNLLSPVIASVCTAFGVNPVNNPNLTTELAAAMTANPNKDAILASLANSPALTQALQAGVAQFGTDFPRIIATLKALSPQAQIYVLNLYNPFNDQDPLYAVFDPLIRGINQAISSNATAGYNVADGYTKFRTTPGAVNFDLATLQLDPHPTTAGHAAIYQALLDAEAGQTSASSYTVSIAPLTGGTITASPTSATSGSAINLSITPDSGMQLKPGTLKYNDGTTDSAISGLSFTMPAANVTITAQFEAIPNSTNGGGGGGRSSSGSSISTGGTTVTGSVINGTTGAAVCNLTATVTTDSNGNYTVSMKAAQTLTFQQPDGKMSSLGDLSKVSYVSDGGSSISVSADGTIKLPNLAKGTDNHYKITYDLGNGATITIGTLEVTVSSGRDVSVKCTLIDPYGIITDAATGKTIAGGKVTLYYANTERNKSNGKTPDTVAALPVIEGFKPNNNQNPQTSDGNGAYGFMVYPDTDYYIVAGKDGYQQYTSPTISVGQEIVRWDFKMNAADNGVNRLAGQSRVDTALAIAKATYTGTLSNVILATANNYPDALAGSVLAHKLNAPILLVGSSETDQAKVMDYLTSNLAQSGTVYILGGTAVVSSAMESRITASGFVKITRIAGIDRCETSVKIAEQLNVMTGKPIILVYEENYPDALSISSIAAEMQYPILLVPKDGLSDVVRNEIAALKPSKVYIIGGEGVISSGVESQVEQITSLDKTNIARIAGEDRYETSLAVAQYFNLSGQTICLATGGNFPDALAGSVYAANHNTSIILADGSLSVQAVNYLKDKKLTGATIFGGEAVVSKGIEQQLGQLIGT